MTNMEKVKEVRLRPAELALACESNPVFEVAPGVKLVIYGMDISEFMTAATDVNARFAIVSNILARYSLNLERLEGTVAAQEFKVDDHSWSITIAENEPLTLYTKPAPFVRNLHDIVSFLQMMPKGSVFNLKYNQRLCLEGLSRDGLANYVEFFQTTTEPSAREKRFEEFLVSESQLLKNRSQVLKVLVENSKNIDLNVISDKNALVMTAVPQEGKQSRFHLVLVDA